MIKKSSSEGVRGGSVRTSACLPFFVPFVFFTVQLRLMGKELLDDSARCKIRESPKLLPEENMNEIS